MRALIVVVVLVAVVAGLALAWPRINRVETGHTPEYPDLQPRTYSAPPARVQKAATAAIAHLSRFRFVGAGQGPRGIDVQAVATTRVMKFDDDVTVRIRSEGGGTRVEVRSASRVGQWDFGQNARNIREFLAALDAEMGR
jgi:uncharacterized protein (DUF1499 family)